MTCRGCAERRARMLRASRSVVDRAREYRMQLALKRMRLRLMLAKRKAGDGNVR